MPRARSARCFALRRAAGILSDIRHDEERASRVDPTRGFQNGAGPVIGLIQAVARVVEHRRRRCRAAERAIVAQVNPTSDPWRSCPWPGQARRCRRCAAARPLRHGLQSARDALPRPMQVQRRVALVHRAPSRVREASDRAETKRAACGGERLRKRLRGGGTKLHDTSCVLDNIPIAMLFAVFEASIETQEHANQFSPNKIDQKNTWSILYIYNSRIHPFNPTRSTLQNRRFRAPVEPVRITPI
jgi:hypothetical protein